MITTNIDVKETDLPLFVAAARLAQRTGDVDLAKEFDRLARKLTSALNSAASSRSGDETQYRSRVPWRSIPTVLLEEDKPADA